MHVIFLFSIKNYIIFTESSMRVQCVYNNIIYNARSRSTNRINIYFKRYARLRIKKILHIYT